MMFRCAALLLLCGIASAQPRFEAASVKAAGDAAHAGIRFRETPGRIHYAATSLREMIMAAYQRKDYQVDSPGWMDAEGYDIDATWPVAAGSDWHEMLRTLLTERFKLRVHTVERPTKVLALRVRPGGSGIPKPDAEPGRGGVAFGVNKINSYSATMENLGDLLSHVLQTPVVDQTGLHGKYSFELKIPHSTTPSGQFDSSAIISSLKDIGLTVASATVTEQYLIVDSADRTPSPN